MTRRPTRVSGSFGVSAAVLAVSLGVGLGCGGSDEPLEFRLGLGGAGPYGASTAVGSSVSSTAISTGSLGGYFEEKDAGDPCLPKPLPGEVPEGWVEYLDWSCTCRMYVPGSKDVMPAPIQWEACPELPGGIQCKVMVTDWDFDGDTPIAIGAPQFDRNPDGTGVLGIRRITMKRRALYDIVADVDGKVRMAILRVGEPTATPECYLITKSVNEGKYLYAAHEDKDEGAIGGSIDDPKPTVLARYRAGWANAGWSAGAKWFMKLSDSHVLRALSWDLSKDIFLTSPSVDPDGDSAAHLLVRGDAIFWSSSSLYHHRFNVWTASGGVRTLLGWVGERTKGAAAFNTDGVDMVWAYGEGKRPAGMRYARRSIMTAPFTTHPEKIQPRRLRSHPYPTLSNERFVVGCGYAAHPMLDQGGVGVMVVRLSDGVAWTIPPTPDFKHPTPIGVTCDEVFLLGHIGGLWNIARVRIDSLGPGLRLTSVRDSAVALLGLSRRACQEKRSRCNTAGSEACPYVLEVDMAKGDILLKPGADVMTRRPTRVSGSFGVSAAVLAVSLGVGLGCGGSDEPLEFRLGLGGAGPYGASTAVGSSVSSTAISTGSLGGYFEEKDAGDPCLPKPLPGEVPEGWVEYLDWSCTCRMYVPGSKDVMPAPIQWEACPELPGGIQCKVMVTDWDFDGDTPIAIGDPQFDRNPDGTGVLGIRRITMKRRALYDIVADVDGQVRMAILRVGEPTAIPDCYLITQSVNEGKYLYGAYENKYEGAIGGSIDDPKPTALARYKKKEWSQAGWSVGAKWIMKLGDGFALRALSWDLSKDIFLTSPSVDPDGKAASHLLVRGNAIFWSSNSLYQRGINIWTESGGVRPFVRWVGDRTKGAAAFDTDGVDMVWAYGEGKRPNGTSFYPRRSIMTAPFTTHPEKIQPRRLRSHPYDTLSNERFVVGCGYAAHPMLVHGGVGVMVVRLSDGVAWPIPFTPEFKHPTPIGVTCDEVFLLGHIGGLWNIARVRIDSLGPGLPPD